MVKHMKATYHNGRYVVTGKDGFFKFSKRVPKSWRVVNTETRKIASPEFYTFEQAVLHADLMVTAHKMGITIINN